MSTLNGGYIRGAVQSVGMCYLPLGHVLLAGIAGIPN